MDNLIALNSAVPMILVMPDGEFDASTRIRYQGNVHTADMNHELMQVIMPLVTRNYRVNEGGTDHAILGVSRGGSDAIMIGLMHHELFGWIGGMSSAILERRQIVSSVLEPADAINEDVKMLAFTCGKSESLLIGLNDYFHQDLTRRGIRHQFSIVEGDHGWPLWRIMFGRFATTVFQATITTPDPARNLLK